MSSPGPFPHYTPVSFNSSSLQSGIGGDNQTTFTLNESGVYAVSYRLSGLVWGSDVLAVLCLNDSPIDTTYVSMSAGAPQDASASVISSFNANSNITLQIVSTTNTSATGASAYMAVQQLA
ncbi:MAG: hypothetical protein LBS96_05625 [Oscillospiraceae bacterium]|nr:hypothetical protein [Oscillospiraceae bacterium]